LFLFVAIRSSRHEAARLARNIAKHSLGRSAFAGDNDAIDGKQGTLPMSTLQDGEMEQLSRLLARGSLSNAREISRLLKSELSEQAEARTDKDLRSQFNNFLRASLTGR